jgi:hypothetical protein
MFIDIGSVWSTDPFDVTDEDRFLEWISYWPEADAARTPHGQWRVFPSQIAMYLAYELGENFVNLPTHVTPYPFDHSVDYYDMWELQMDDWELPEEAGGVADPMTFLKELSNHVAAHDMCVLKELINDYGDTHATAYLLVSGPAAFEARMAVLTLDDVMGKIGTLQRGTAPMLMFDDSPPPQQNGMVPYEHDYSDQGPADDAGDEFYPDDPDDFYPPDVEHGYPDNPYQQHQGW